MSLLDFVKKAFNYMFNLFNRYQAIHVIYFSLCIFGWFVSFEELDRFL